MRLVERLYCDGAGVEGGLVDADFVGLCAGRRVRLRAGAEGTGAGVPADTREECFVRCRTCVAGAASAADPTVSATAMQATVALSILRITSTSSAA
jgi:hypothetical protein